MRTAARYLPVALVLGVVYAGWVFLSRWNANRQWERARSKRMAAPYRDPYGLDRIRGLAILQFYVTPAVIREGESGTLCYGVANAKAVRIEPGVEPVIPSLNRCVSISPADDTKYTLTAEGDDGRNLTASLTVKVRLDPANTPRIRQFAVGETREDRGRNVYLLCFVTDNSEEVRIDPPVIPATGALRGCFYVTPQQPTTYTLTAVGPTGRKAERQITLGVPAPAL